MSDNNQKNNQNTILEPTWEALYPDPQIRAVAQNKWNNLKENLDVFNKEREGVENEAAFLKKAESMAEMSEERLQNKIDKLAAEMQKITSGSTVSTPSAPKESKPAPAEPMPAPKIIPVSVIPENNKPVVNKAISNDVDSSLPLDKQLEQAKAISAKLKNSDVATVSDLANIQKIIYDLEQKLSPLKPEVRPDFNSTPTQQPEIKNNSEATNESAHNMVDAPETNQINNEDHTEPSEAFQNESQIIEVLATIDKGRSIYDLGQTEYNKLHIVKAVDGGLYLVFGNVDDPGNPYVAHFSTDELQQFNGLLDAIDVVLFDKTPRQYTLLN
ncbi:MAG: hypothetical protein V1898_03460 [Patescibacteria group bacterium]